MIKNNTIQKTDCCKDVFFCRVLDDSMCPKIENGDLVQFRRCFDAPSGAIVLALVDGDPLCRKIVFDGDALELCPIDRAHKTLRFEEADISHVTILGRAERIHHPI